MTEVEYRVAILWRSKSNSSAGNFVQSTLTETHAVRTVQHGDTREHKIADFYLPSFQNKRKGKTARKAVIDQKPSGVTLNVLRDNTSDN
jgi:hypothetical protein